MKHSLPNGFTAPVHLVVLTESLVGSVRAESRHHQNDQSFFLKSEELER